MQTSTNIMDKDFIIHQYIQERIDDMNPQDRLAMLYDFMVDSYENYTIEEVKEEVEEHYPHLLNDELIYTHCED